ncbi:carotenoid oxygenase family protein [Thalassomonas haliotis]|uniref:Carotenoid oxygenase family protein n=1 Tax=Thalassomonas haliotis TaxID=485448 RepID=A0ABY7VMJ0_9GAMM|nr:carotenoid oxygenase family protein [Thalassomonas haliotis]WDE14201.1 carotenoid oxygenase family protein [Thalassomonas haliotis]
MDRRRFIKTAGVLSALPMVSFGHEQSQLAGSSFPTSIMHGSLTESADELTVLSGQLPQDVFGHVLMTEGISLEENQLTPNGRGALTRVDFSADSAAFTRKMINTPSAIMQEHVTAPFDKFALLGGTVYFSMNLGFMNYCNTAPNYMGNNRFALSYEGGMPFEFDATTLELVTPIGQPWEWHSSLPPFADLLAPDKWLFPQVRTTGHPYFDLENEQCFTINYGGNMGESGLKNGFIRLIRWDLSGPFDSWQVIGRNGENAYITATSHSLNVTRNHILIFETAARVENARIMGIRTVTAQKHRTPVWIIRKADLHFGQSIVFADYLELDFDTSDIMCNYQDDGDIITLYGQYLGAMDKSEPQFDWESLYFGGRVDSDIAGYPAAPVDIGGLVRARIQVNAVSSEEIKGDFEVIRDQSLCWDMNDPAYRGHFQFPETFEHIYWAAVGYRPEHLVKRVAKAYEDYPNRYYQNETLPQSAQPSALIHMDCSRMVISDSYQFPEDCVMRTPQFMARKNSTAQDDGYIFTAVVRKEPSQGQFTGKEFWLFDAKNLSRGPVCILGSAKLDFATSNHALWVPEIGPRPPLAYKADLNSYFQDRLDCHSRQVQEVLTSYVLPKFT